MDEERESALALIGRMTESRHCRLRFPSVLEARFETETRPQRCRSLSVHTMILIGVYSSALIFDYALVGEMFWMAALVRLVFLIAPQILVLFLISRRCSPALREGTLAFGILSATIGTLFIVQMSDSPFRLYYTNGVIFVLLYVIGIERLRFWYALVASVGTMAFYAVAILNMDVLGPVEAPAIVAIAAALTAYVLYVNFMFERHERRLWLRAYGDRLKAMEFEQLAELDPMTGLGNRRAMQNWLDATSVRETDDPISFVLADIDHFKSYNDTHGHMQGDDCIRNVANALSAEAARFGGRTFRFGGEEFVIVLIGRDRAQTHAAAEAMRQQVLDTRQPHRTTDGPGVVSCSFGYATGRLEDELDVSALITEADFALYAAKSAGRNQVMPPLEDEDAQILMAG